MEEEGKKRDPPGRGSLLGDTGGEQELEAGVGLEILYFVHGLRVFKCLNADNKVPVERKVLKDLERK